MGIWTDSQVEALDQLVSIQLVSPASGDEGDFFELSYGNCRVSIQLVSPASGDPPIGRSCPHWCRRSFHSIGIPSEWGLEGVTDEKAWAIMFPFNWYPQRVGIPRLRQLSYREYLVSIQLVSPASGDFSRQAVPSKKVWSFHSIGIPSEWGSPEAF